MMSWSDLYRFNEPLGVGFEFPLAFSKLIGACGNPASGADWSFINITDAVR
jgi:hypothetical protein